MFENVLFGSLTQVKFFPTICVKSIVNIAPCSSTNYVTKIISIELCLRLRFPSILWFHVDISSTHVLDCFVLSVLVVPRRRTKLADRSISVVGPKWWNALPSHLKNIDSESEFRKKVKDLSIRTILFINAKNRVHSFNWTWDIIFWTLYWHYKLCTAQQNIIILSTFKNANYFDNETIILCVCSHQLK